MICRIGSSTEDSIQKVFEGERLASRQTDGTFLVLKPVEFDKANRELSAALYRDKGILNDYFYRVGKHAWFNRTLALYADASPIQETFYTNGFIPAPSPFTDKTVLENERTPTSALKGSRLSKELLDSIPEGPLRAAYALSGGMFNDRPLPEDQEALVEEYAVTKGIWYPNTKMAFGEIDFGGFESDVWAESGQVLKSSTTNLYGEVFTKLESVVLYNHYFPEAPYTVVGFGRNSDEDFTILFQQRAVRGNPTSESQIQNFFKEKGFEGMDGTYTKGSVTAYDAYGYNMHTEKGKVVAFDLILTHSERPTEPFGLPDLTPNAGYKTPCK
jgi:hypothetical protein